MAKKPIKRPRLRSQTDDPKGERRAADADMSMQRKDARRLIDEREYQAQLAKMRPKR